MKQLLVLAALVVAAQSIGKWKEGLSVRFDVGLGAGRNFFIKVPQTVQQAKNARWVESPRPAGQPRPSLVLYNPSRDDVVLGALYDQSGNVAGVQIALPSDQFTDSAYPWDVQGFTTWDAPEDSQGRVRRYYITAVYFISDAFLAKSHEERALSPRVLQDDYVYLTSINGDLLPVPIVGTEVPKQTDFKRQNCIPGMGRHYFYNMTRQTPDCYGEQMVPWFALTDESLGANQLIGVGLTTFGKLPVEGLKKDYFERPPELAARLIITDGPPCLWDNVSKHGLVTMHIYFVDNPLLINCLFT